jgi:hypothetical protein
VALHRHLRFCIPFELLHVAVASVEVLVVLLLAVDCLVKLGDFGLVLQQQRVGVCLQPCRDPSIRSNGLRPPHRHAKSLPVRQQEHPVAMSDNLGAGLDA